VLPQLDTVRPDPNARGITVPLSSQRRSSGGDRSHHSELDFVVQQREGSKIGHVDALTDLLALLCTKEHKIRKTFFASRRKTPVQNRNSETTPANTSSSWMMTASFMDADLQTPVSDTQNPSQGYY